MCLDDGVSSVHLGLSFEGKAGTGAKLGDGLKQSLARQPESLANRVRVSPRPSTGEYGHAPRTASTHNIEHNEETLLESEIGRLCFFFLKEHSNYFDGRDGSPQRVTFESEETTYLEPVILRIDDEDESRVVHHDSRRPSEETQRLRTPTVQRLSAHGPTRDVSVRGCFRPPHSARVRDRTHDHGKSTLLWHGDVIPTCTRRSVLLPGSAIDSAEKRAVISEPSRSLGGAVTVGGHKPRAIPPWGWKLDRSSTRTRAAARGARKTSTPG